MTSRDNIAGIGGGPLLRLFLLPGMVIQWAAYMFVGGKSYGRVRQDTRLARSPLMTFVYAGAFWLVLGAYIMGVFR